MAFEVSWLEDSDVTILGRITSRSGSGSATGIAGEGNWLQVADISTITWSVFDLNSATPDTAITTGAVTVATAVLDTPVTATTIWTKDATGYNFIHDLGAANFPTGDRTYSVEYVVTLTSGAVFHGVYKGVAVPVRSS